MREFVKSMMSYTWAMSLFGVQQAINVLTPQGQQPSHPATNAFNNVAGAAREEFGRTVESAFRVGDNVQRAMVDATFSVFTLGAFNRGGGGRSWGDTNAGATAAGATQAASDAARQTAAGATRAASDFGRGTAEAFNQGMRATRQTADVIGQAVAGSVGRRGRRDNPQPQDFTGGGARFGTDAGS
jgi:hypothetical protein